MKKTLYTLLAIGLTSTGAIADSNADIMARQAAMKAVGAGAKAKDFDAINKNAIIAKAAFMNDTSADGTAETTAIAAIWTDKAKFDGILDQLITASAAGDAGATFATCKACHSEYRIKK